MYILRISSFYVLQLYPYPIFLFFFNDPATTEIYTLSLHDALPISSRASLIRCSPSVASAHACPGAGRDRKSTRLNSSHVSISYAVFCLKKKKWEDYAGSLLSIIVVCVPGLVVGPLLIVFYAIKLRLLPVALWIPPWHVFFFLLSLDHQYLHSFPTRRSSD